MTTRSLMYLFTLILLSAIIVYYKMWRDSREEKHTLCTYGCVCVCVCVYDCIGACIICKNLFSLLFFNGEIVSIEL